MTGVEILNQYTVASEYAFNYWIMIGIFALSLLVGIACVVFGDADWGVVFIILIVGIGLGGVFGAVVGCAVPLEEHQVTRYEVTVDDTVSMNDFYEKYEIIEQKGRIYVVEERE